MPLLLESLWHDARYALRGMRHSPAFTTVAILSLALGIGANTAIFSLMDSVMLRSLPVREPHDLVELLGKYPGEPRGSYFSLASYDYYRDHNHVFSDLIGLSPSRFNVRGDGLEPETVDGEYVIENFFPALGVRPALGRLIAPGDADVAVVSWSYWKNRFNLDPAILGKRITVEEMPLTIIGVTPREFFGVQPGFRPDIWIPIAAEAMMHHPSRIGPGGLQLMGRLKTGVSFDQARAEMKVLFQYTIDERSRASKNPEMRRLRFEMEPAGAGLTYLRDQFAQPLVLLMAVVGLLLLIACTNLASMLLARGAARRHEMAVRVSLGAGRFRLMRQVLTESLLLSAAGSLIGIFVAYSGAQALALMLTSGRLRPGPRLEITVEPDLHVLLFTAGMAVLSGLLFGLAPAWNAFVSMPAFALREMRLRRRFGMSLVVAQVAFALVLLSAASLFIRHLSHLENIDLGFRRDHVLLVTLNPARSGYNDEQLSLAYRELLARLSGLPGVRSATLSAPTPLSGAGASRFATIEGHRERSEDRRYISVSWVAPRYFETLGTPLLAGRDFTFQDQGGARVAIVNQALAHSYFSGRNPIGKHLTFDGDDKPYEIVGIAGDAKYYEIREVTPRAIYLNAFQEGHVSSQFVLRTSVQPTSVTPQVRRTVHEILKTVPVSRVTTLADQVDATIVPERLIATLSGLFGALGSLLTALGLYGLLAYTVARRINEIGIRMALGATRGHVVRMVLGEALAMVSAGVVIGVPVAFWCARFAASLVEGLPLQSSIAIASGTFVMIAVALAAAYLPARRAARVDPIAALHYE